MNQNHPILQYYIARCDALEDTDCELADDYHECAKSQLDSFIGIKMNVTAYAVANDLKSPIVIDCKRGEYTDTVQIDFDTKDPINVYFSVLVHGFFNSPEYQDYHKKP